MTFSNEALLLGADIDGTLLAGDREESSVQKEANAALHALTMAIAKRRNRRALPLFYGTDTGRTLQSHTALEQENSAFKHSISYAGFAIGSVGAEIAVRDKKTAQFSILATWPNAVDWDPEKIQEALLTAANLGSLKPQPDIAQSSYKRSFFTDTQLDHDEFIAQVSQRLSQRNIAAQVIFSHGTYLDLLPKRADDNPVDKGSGLLHCADYLAARDQLDTRPRLIFAEDSDNGMGGLRAVVQAEGFGIVPSNAHPDFQQRVKSEFGDSIYIARQPFAAGVHEGFEHFTRIQ